MLTVKLFGTNAKGVPTEWPQEVRQLKQGETSSQGWITMTESQYAAYRQQYQSAYDAWYSSNKLPDGRIIAMWRVRATLKVMALDDKVDQLLLTLSEPKKTIATTAWNYGNIVERNSDIIKFLQAGLKLTTAQVEEIFDKAEAITI
jgi:hypothetical protein